MTDPPTAPQPPRLRSTQGLNSLRIASSHPTQRRLLLAFVLFRTTEMSAWLVTLVWAFDRGGATGSGVIAVGQMVPAALFATFGAAWLERLPRARALPRSYLLQAATKLVLAAVLIVGAPFWVVVAATALSAAMVTLTRPIHHALIPEVSRTPQELTAANAASTAAEGIGDLAGPTLAGLALLVVAPGGVILGLGILIAGAAGLVRNVEVVQVRNPPSGSTMARTLTGARALIDHRAPAALVLLVGGQFVVLGILSVFGVVFALEVLGSGPDGPGYLASGLGLGALVGVILAVSLVGRRHLGVALAASLTVLSVPIGLVAAAPTLGIAVLLFVVAGVGRAGVDVAVRTLLQRSAPPRVLGRILGIQESLQTAGLALGTALAPAFVFLAGPRGAFIVAAALLPATGLAVAAPIRRLDQTAPPDASIDLLLSVPMFAALPAPQIEQLARALEPPHHLRAEHPLLTQGADGEHCYIITAGRVRIEHDGQAIAHLGEGDLVGEIALLRDVPRTATATAVDDVEVVALARQPFLMAVTGSDRGLRHLEEVVDQRLQDRDGPGSA